MSLNRIQIPIIYHGKNSLKELRKVNAQKVLIITDDVIYTIHGELISKFFKKKEIRFFDEVKPDPLDTTITKGGEIAREFKPDLIVGFGGGSILDTAKLVYFLYENEDKTLYQCGFTSLNSIRKKSTLILIPTTSGTGAEHTIGAVITNTKTGQKVALASQELLPHVVIIDPKLTLSMPPSLTASTGFDAIVHAIEGLTVNTRSDFSDAFNFYALKLLIKYLPIAVKEGANDIAVREKLHNAASLAGMGFGHAGCALVHACGHSLGAVHHIQHGIAVGIMLPYIIEFNKLSSEEIYANILDYLNIPSDNDATSTLANYFRNFLNQVKIPNAIQDLEISNKDWDEKLGKVVDFTQADPLRSLNPRVPKENEIKKIFEYAYFGKSIDF